MTISKMLSIAAGEIEKTNDFINKKWHTLKKVQKQELIYEFLDCHSQGIDLLKLEISNDKLNDIFSDDNLDKEFMYNIFKGDLMNRLNFALGSNIANEDCYMAFSIMNKIINEEVKHNG